MAANRGTPRKYEIQTKAEADEATIYLYDIIDPYWGVGAAQFVKDLAALSAGTIHLRINSPGGDVFDGRAIATALREHKAKVVTYIDGLAASAASYIALAGDEVVIAPGAMMMIHRASSLAWGNAEDMRKLAGVLDKIDDSLVAEYVRETGQDEAQVRDWLDAETWFTAEEAVEYGFADRLSDATPVENKQRWDISALFRQESDGDPEEIGIGDRVTVKDGDEHDEMTKGGTGTVEMISTHALGIRFDDMPDTLHKWYVASELERVTEEEDSDPEASGDKKKKKMPHKMQHSNDADDQHAERVRRLRLVELNA